MEGAEGETRVYDEVVEDVRWNPYPGLADREDVEGEIAGGRSGSGWASARTARPVGLHPGFPSVGLREYR